MCKTYSFFQVTDLKTVMSNSWEIWTIDKFQQKQQLIRENEQGNKKI